MLKYIPSNGTEGIIFFNQFCDKCVYETEEEPCKIIADTMLYNIDDPEYPIEWAYDRDGFPTCTEFKEAIC